MAQKIFGNLELRSNSLLKLFEAAANGTSSVQLKAPAALGADREFTLPGAVSADDVLTSDASGVMAFVKLANANISATAAIAYSKLDLADSIEDADIAAAAAISLSKLAPLTASRALVSDGSGVISASAVTATELGYLSGVTSAIQTQLGDKIDSSEKGANNGVATLDAGGKVPASQLPNSVMEFQGAWNASTNSPTLADGTGNNGDVYRVSVAGTQNLGSGNLTFAVGDFVIYNGTIWQRSPASDLGIYALADLSNLTVSGLAAESLLVGSSSSAVAALAAGSNGDVLTVVGGALAWAAPSSAISKVSATWATADGTTKVVTHSLGTKDVQVEVYDMTDDSTIMVDAVVRTDSNTVTLTASEAPGASSWRVVVIG